MSEPYEWPQELKDGLLLSGLLQVVDKTALPIEINVWQDSDGKYYSENTALQGYAEIPGLKEVTISRCPERRAIDELDFEEILDRERLKSGCEDTDSFRSILCKDVEDYISFYYKLHPKYRNKALLQLAGKFKNWLSLATVANATVQYNLETEPPKQEFPTKSGVQTMKLIAESNPKSNLSGFAILLDESKLSKVQQHNLIKYLKSEYSNLNNGKEWAKIMITLFEEKLLLAGVFERKKYNVTRILEMLRSDFGYSGSRQAFEGPLAALRADLIHQMPSIIEQVNLQIKTYRKEILDIINLQDTTNPKEL
jgi:hypothetical protein